MLAPSSTSSPAYQSRVHEEGFSRAAALDSRVVPCAHTHSFTLDLVEMSENGAGLAASRSLRPSDGAPTILSHLLTLPSQTLTRLYGYPSNTLSIFRLVPPIARHLILTLLFLPDPPQLPSADIASLLAREGSSSRGEDPSIRSGSGRHNRSLRGLEEAKDVLSRLRITRETSGIVYLNAVWTKSFRRALVGGGDHQSFGVPSEKPAESRLSARQLDEFALRSWESILLYMVASSESHTPSYPVLYLLRTAGLMQPEDGTTTHTFDSAPGNRRGANSLENMTITSAGFQFLLEDVSTQLWLLLHTYLITLAETSSSTTNDSTNADIVEHLTFLFTLSSATLGQDYDATSLKQSQREMLVFFRDLGLVYQRNERSASFYPTRLVTTLTNSSQLPLMGNSEEKEEEEKGFVILETNYKVYAYTNNKLRIDVLSLFVHIRSKFPNLVMGIITRDSVKEALRNGIGAEQIIMYLSHHAHPQMYKNDPLLPVTVTDQIRLWEREKNRLQTDEGVLHSDFHTGADFELVREYADKMGVLLWHDAMKRMLFISSSGVAPVRDFIDRRRMLE